MNKKVIVSASTVLSSLIAYWFAKEAKKDAVPYVMIGGFLGSIIGETISEEKDNKPKN